MTRLAPGESENSLQHYKVYLSIDFIFHFELDELFTEIIRKEIKNNSKMNFVLLKSIFKYKNVRYFTGL